MIEIDGVDDDAGVMDALKEIVDDEVEEEDDDNEKLIEMK